MEDAECKRTFENIEAWVLKSGTASLASALYLIKHLKIQPSRVHLLDAHASLEASHHEGNALRGYHQFAGCLPVPGGLPIEELLAMVPSTKLQSQSILGEIQTSQARQKFANENKHTIFLAQKNGIMKELSTRSFDLTIKHRVYLVRFLLKREKSLLNRQIRNLFPGSFSDSVFYKVLSVHCVLGWPYKIIALKSKGHEFGGGSRDMNKSDDLRSSRR